MAHTMSISLEIRNGGIGIFESSQIININSGIKRCFTIELYLLELHVQTADTYC